MIWQQWALIGLQIIGGMIGFVQTVEGRPEKRPLGAGGGLVYLLLLAGVIYLHIVSGTYTIHNS